MDESTLDQLLQIIKKRRIEGNMGDVDYQIGHKNIKGQMKINDATIRALLGYNGNLSLNAQSPLLGGSLNLDASHADAGNNYHLGYQRPLDGGALNLDASRGEDGNRRFYLRLQKQF